MSMLPDTASDLNRRIADRIRELRAAKGLSLDALATKSGVSRSMISLIERGETSATAVVLEKLARALDVALASLFDRAATSSPARSSPISRRRDRQTWRDPQSGYVRCNVSPSNVSQPMQIVEVHFPPGGSVAFETGARDVRIYQQIWVLDGSIDLSVGDEHHRLQEGDCIATELDRPMVFKNRTRKTVRYAVVIVSEPISRR